MSLRCQKHGTTGQTLFARAGKYLTGSTRTGHTPQVAEIKVEIIFHKPSEWERFQTRIGRWSIEDVAATIEKNKTREAYGSREDTITLTLPGA